MEAGDFAVVDSVAALLRNYAGPWWVAGGWALDLWLARVTREHADVEIAIPLDDQLALRSYLADFVFRAFVPRQGGGKPEIALGPGDRLELPAHEMHGTATADPAPHGVRALEVLLNEIDAQGWRYRRDGRVWLPRTRLACHTATGLPYLPAEIVLLYKAGSSMGVRPHDVHDFAIALPALGEPARAWLRGALSLAHPGHPWIEQLA